MSKKILVVDDEKSILSLAQEVLDGYEVRTAASVHECLEKLQDYEPDLIITDFNMEGVGKADGYKLTKQLRESGVYEGPVILMSGNMKEAFDAYGDAARNYFAGFIEKPFSPLDLLAEVNSMLGESPSQ